ncbi:hypothetical protein [Nostoc sphaeroides]|uniref:HNH endonuclease n=1 Tax=Nostoc sphaeroides CCNUC1 TaxID=2653204 RepID=A0A5P8W365_9NOSO|nr:hypothetical protein [Nostoc sphaeroides]QFS47143.1 HNH endonuclease [Nostoc sphaeroides CCNUC1]
MNRYYTAIAQQANHRCDYCQAPELSFRFDAGLGIGLSTMIENRK